MFWICDEVYAMKLWLWLFLPMSCPIFGMRKFEGLKDCLPSKEVLALGKVNDVFAKVHDVLLVVAESKG